MEDGWRAKRRAEISTRIEIAALGLFAEHGIDQVTVDDIAEASAISRRTFYRYFNDIDDVVAAMPMRSLRRLSCEMHARPSSEGLREAFLATMRETRVSDTDRQILKLATAAFNKSPDAWWRALAKMRPTSTEFYQQMVADRLRVSGLDPAPAGLIGAVLITVFDQALKNPDGEAGSHSRLLEQALDTLVDHLAHKTVEQSR